MKHAIFLLTLILGFSAWSDDNFCGRAKKVENYFMLIPGRNFVMDEAKATELAKYWQSDVLPIFDQFQADVRTPSAQFEFNCLVQMSLATAPFELPTSGGASVTVAGYANEKSFHLSQTLENAIQKFESEYAQGRDAGCRVLQYRANVAEEFHHTKPNCDYERCMKNVKGCEPR